MNTSIQDGCHIARWALISSDVKIGRHVSVGPFSDLGHDTTIGNYSHLGAYTFTGGFSQIGEEVTIHPRCNILPHKKIGNRSIIGAGSIVIKNVKPDISVFGIPAKQI